MTFRLAASNVPFMAVHVSVLVAWVLAAPEPLREDVRIDLPVTAALGAAWLVSEYAFKPELAPTACRWCATNALDEAVRTLRGSAAGQHAADLTSDVLGVALTPIAVIATDVLLCWRADGGWKDGAVDALLILEAMVASQAVNQSVKFSVARERPFVAALSPSQKPLTTQPDDNDLSFFSGHAAYVFALVTAGATVARLRGYEHWWAILAAGLPLAVATATLRLIADKHYLSDVVIGGSIGSLLGFVLPMAFHRPLSLGPISASVAGGVGGVAIVGAW